MEEYIKFEIEDFGIFFQYPEWWEHKLEKEDTYLFWDEYVGSFRITPIRLKKGGPNLAQFLAEEQAKHPDGKMKRIGRYEFVTRQQDDPQSGGSTTRVHYYVGGYGDTVLLCSYAYALELLDDEFDRDAVEAGIEEAEILIEGLNFGEED